MTSNSNSKETNHEDNHNFLSSTSIISRADQEQIEAVSVPPSYADVIENNEQFPVMLSSNTNNNTHEIQHNEEPSVSSRDPGTINVLFSASQPDAIMMNTVL